MYRTITSSLPGILQQVRVSQPPDLFSQGLSGTVAHHLLFRCHNYYITILVYIDHINLSFKSSLRQFFPSTHHIHWFKTWHKPSKYPKAFNNYIISTIFRRLWFIFIYLFILDLSLSSPSNRSLEPDFIPTQDIQGHPRAYRINWIVLPKVS